MANILDRMTRIGRLYDFYGPLLTPKQRQWLELHYHHDLSLGEIAALCQVSRQAVYDGLQRAEKALEDYEARLGYLERYSKEREKLEEVARRLSAFKESRCWQEFDKALQQLEQLLEWPVGDGRGQGGRQGAV
ncbi:YlxM family DNA-binding protein [Thermanaeromonas sp. C210]|uniref:YlxM family DNA-binding protein n=1 Tax=Thermanaeromonas sp. C210 TaxID=2731925 RepID=UPI001C26AC78|nr:YlxM family DNA-binding protein [Thermanaeromonas sp. C210]